MQKRYVGAIDQGTTSTRFILFDHDSNIVCSHQLEHKQYYPRSGYVEHNALEIWQNTTKVISEALRKGNIKSTEIAAIGITNQRETTVLWNPKTGIPYHKAIVWQDTRTDKICQQLTNEIGDKLIKQKTGLPLATYFSAPKIKWLLENDIKLKKAALNGELLFGTIDTWLIWNLTGGKKGGKHITDVTNASRTMLMDLEKLEWDEELLRIFNIPKIILPEIRPSSDSEFYGFVELPEIFSERIPICGDLGDQQAALFGQNCLRKGEAKNTYGTGCFLLINTGNEVVHSTHGLLTTVACQIDNEPATYALEGSVAIAGSLVQWFRDNFGLITSSERIEELARSVDDNGGLFFVPAFSGLFAPYWNSGARGILVGLTHFINKGHMARAILEATAFQTKEVFDAMMKDSGFNLKHLKVDGGMTANELLMQFQADILDVEVIRPVITETTALGAAYAAGLAVGFWKDTKILADNWKANKTWKSKMRQETRSQEYFLWQKAVKKSLDWID
jgi:glycerol kinase